MFITIPFQLSKLLESIRFKDGHDLFEIFNALPDEIKEAILNGKEKVAFYQHLVQISDVFKKWRFIYEREISSIDFGFLMNFGNELSIIASKM